VLSKTNVYHIAVGDGNYHYEVDVDCHWYARVCWPVWRISMLRESTIMIDA